MTFRHNIAFTVNSFVFPLNISEMIKFFQKISSSRENIKNGQSNEPGING